MELYQVAHTRLHLRRRFVGKGDGGDGFRRHLVMLDEMHNLLRNDPRLAAARTGQHQQGAIDIAHSFALRGI